MKNIKKAIVGTLTAAAALPVAALAQNDIWGLNQTTGIGLSSSTLQQTVTTIIRTFMGLLGLIAVILILYGGFMWMTAAGNEEKVTKAKQIIISGIIGLLIIASAYAIASFVITQLLPK